MDGRLCFVRGRHAPSLTYPPPHLDSSHTHIYIHTRTWVSGWGKRMSSLRQTNLVFLARMLLSCARVRSRSSPSISKVTWGWRMVDVGE